MKYLVSSLLLMVMLIPAHAQRLTILHTNDMHSRLLGFAPISDYTPTTTNDDQTIGGFARIATLIKEEKESHPEEVLVVDGGDFLMGTLFHVLEAETGFQLRLMNNMGYEAVAIGNHEFDWGVEVLSDIIAKSVIKGKIPQLLLSNINFSDIQKQDDLLENLMKRGTIKPYTIIEKNGLKIGIFGILGYEAAMVAPYVVPAAFSDPIQQAAKRVSQLRDEEKVDLIICLSHSGVSKDKNGNWVGEDYEMAKKVPGIDVIVSGHSHTHLFEPLVVGNTIIVQAGSEGRFLGKLEIEKTPEGVKLISAGLRAINDEIPGDPGIQRMIDDQKHLIQDKVLAQYSFEYDKPIVETSFDLTFSEQGDLKTSELGPLLADALYWYANQLDPFNSDIVLMPGGIIRDNIIKGSTGMQLPADIFRILPLGMGVYETTPGYSMTKVYLTGREIKNVLEVMMLAPKISSGNYPFWSGVRYKYNTLRMPLDQIYEVAIGNDTDGYQPIKLNKDETQLYGLITNAYILEFFGLIKDMTKGMLKVVPKFANGTPIPDLRMPLIDHDINQPGVQEAKEWAGLMMYLNQLPDLNGNGIPDIPEKYHDPEGYSAGKASINPVLYVKGTNGITLVPAILAGAILTGVGFIVL